MTRLVILMIAGTVLMPCGREAGAWPEMSTAGSEAMVWLSKGSPRSKPAPLKYKVVGVFQKDKQFVGGSAVADVTKQVEFEFKWPLEDGVSPKVLPNIPTKVVRYRDGSAVCPAPILKGAYEHFELKSILVMGPMFGLVGERRTPDMEEYVGGGGCKGTHPVQGQVREEQLLVTLPPEFLAGQLSKGQVCTQQDQGWTWTFTPVP